MDELRLVVGKRFFSEFRECGGAYSDAAADFTVGRTHGGERNVAEGFGTMVAILLCLGAQGRCATRWGDGLRLRVRGGGGLEPGVFAAGGYGECITRGTKTQFDDGGADPLRWQSLCGRLGCSWVWYRRDLDAVCERFGNADLQGLGLKVTLAAPWSLARTMIQIFARGTRTILLEIDEKTSVLDLKNKLWDREGVPASRILVVFGGKLLSDDRSLTSYGICQESTIYWRVRFGP